MLKIGLSKTYAFEPFLWVFYVWYYLPLARAFFFSGTFNLIFFSIFACGCALCLFEYLKHSKHIPLKFTPLVPVLLYFIIFLFLVLLDVATATRHIRVSFTFWGTLIVYYLTGAFPRARNRLTNLMIVMFFITIVTSMIGVIINPVAARTLAYASNDIEEDLVIRLLNIGGIAFFQGLVICVPILITFIYHNQYRVWAIVLLITVGISLLFASFTISLSMFLVAVLIGYLVNNSAKKRSLLAIMITILLIIIPWLDILMFLCSLFNIEEIMVRLEALATFGSTGVVGGNLESRVEVYLASINTFLEHPLGVGPEYSFVTLENGIGYHSQFLDDLARYGIFGLVFHIAFIVGYYQLLHKQWGKVHLQQIALPVSLIYFFFLALNPGFTSPHEGVLLLFLIPAFPEFMKSGTMESRLD